MELLTHEHFAAGNMHTKRFFLYILYETRNWSVRYKWWKSNIKLKSRSFDLFCFLLLLDIEVKWQCNIYTSEPRPVQFLWLWWCAIDSDFKKTQSTQKEYQNERLKIAHTTRTKTIRLKDSKTMKTRSTFQPKISCKIQQLHLSRWIE